MHPPPPWSLLQLFSVVNVPATLRETLMSPLPKQEPQLDRRGNQPRRAPLYALVKGATSREVAYSTLRDRALTTGKGGGGGGGLQNGEIAGMILFAPLPPTQDRVTLFAPPSFNMAETSKLPCLNYPKTCCGPTPFSMAKIKSAPPSFFGRDKTSFPPSPPFGKPPPCK